MSRTTRKLPAVRFLYPAHYGRDSDDWALVWELRVDEPTVGAKAGDELYLFLFEGRGDADLPLGLNRDGRRIANPTWRQARHLFSDPETLWWLADLGKTVLPRGEV